MLKTNGKGIMKNRVVKAVDEISYKLYSASKQSDNEYKNAYKKYEDVNCVIQKI